jgi:hypothetical protein
MNLRKFLIYDTEIILKVEQNKDKIYNISKSVITSILL